MVAIVICGYYNIITDSANRKALQALESSLIRGFGLVLFLAILSRNVLTGES